MALRAGGRRGLTLPAMARALADLLRALGMAPALVVGHSAGAAIALQLVQDGRADHGGAGVPVIGFNPALMPFPGLAAQLFPSLARLLFVNPLVPRMLAGIARLPGEPERFLKRATGSTIDAPGLACYRALLGCPAHCAGAMEMMASWDLDALRRRLPTMAMPVHLVHARADAAVPLHTVEAAARLLPHAHLTVLPHGPPRPRRTPRPGGRRHRRADAGERRMNGWIEIVFTAAVAIGFGVYQLWSVNREIRRDREKRDREKRDRE
jgi:magnesium chelatase accessory protein